MLSTYARVFALLGLVGLAASLVWWHLQPIGWGVKGAIILCLPLLLPLPGMLRGNAYTHAWASLMLLFYMVYVLTELVGGAARGIAIPAALSTAVMFCSCLIYVKFRAREREAGGK